MKTPRAGKTAKSTTPKTRAQTMDRKRTNPRIGSDFEDFLRKEGRLEESTAVAGKRVLAWELEEAMKRANVSQAEMARRMTRPRVDPELLDVATCRSRSRP
jgi:hypothetical protein